MSTEKTEEKNELMAIIQNSGIEQKTANTIIENFKPFFEQAAKWKQKATEIVITDASQTLEMKIAKEIRKALRGIRVDADKTRKVLKEDSLRYGKAIQNVYNAIEDEITPLEKHLEDQEKFIERQEEKRKSELKQKRTYEISPYSQFVPFNIDLGELSEEDYQKTLNGAKLQHEDFLEKEKKAEEDRIAKQKADEEERERIRIENERLTKEKKEREEADAKKKAIRLKRSEELKPYIIFIRDYNAMIEMEEELYKRELADIKKGAEQHWEYERKEEARKEKERNEKEAQVQKAKKEAAAAQAKLKAKQQEEDKRRKDEAEKAEAQEKARKLAEKKAKQAPDKEKLLLLAQKIEQIDFPTMKSESGEEVLESTKELLTKVSKYIRDKANLF